jgi:hypothetical protein
MNSWLFVNELIEIFKPFLKGQYDQNFYSFYFINQSLNENARKTV